MKITSLLVGSACIFLATVSAFAARLGDPAAPLAIKDWVKGSPVNVKDGKNIYVVEFWATWCGPCRKSIPHLSELQKKFKDKNVVFVGISDEAASKVQPFVEKMADQMAYTVACDDDRKSTAGYMQAYGQGGIPTAFIVGKEGKVLWFGHPMAELESTLEKIVTGKFDLQSAIRRDESRAMLADYQKLAVEGDAEAAVVGKKLLAGAGDDVEALSDLAFNIAANASVKNRDFALADQALDRAEKLSKEKDHRILGIRSVIRFEAGRQEEGLALAKQAVELAKDGPDKTRYEHFVRVMEARVKAKAAPAQPDAKE